MSTTPRTDAALLSSDCAYNCGHTFKLLSEEKYDQGKCVYTGPDIANGNDNVVVLADFARELETELARLRAELATCKNAAESLVYGQRAENDRLIDENVELTARAERAEAELKASRYETVKAAQEGLRECIRAERAEAALAFIAANGGTTHETECGPIACNGSWCAQQARAAIDAAMKP